MNNNIKGISWMLASCLANSIMLTIIRHLSEEFQMHPFLIVFCRNAAALIIFLPWLMYSGEHTLDFKVLKTKRIKMYWSRAFMGLVAMYFWFYSLTVVPLSLATALSFTAPLFTAVLAVIIFGEKYGVKRWGALAVGFFGTMIVLRPGAEGFDFNSIYVIIAAIFWALSGLMIKSLSKTDDPIVVAFYMVLMMTPMTVPLAIPYWQDFSAEMLLWLLALGFFSNIFQVAMTKAFAATDLIVVMPFDFTRLIFISVLAYIAFGETMDIWTAIGSCIIMASAVYAAYRERIHSKNKEVVLQNDMRL